MWSDVKVSCDIDGCGSTALAPVNEDGTVTAPHGWITLFRDQTFYEYAKAIADEVVPAFGGMADVAKMDPRGAAMINSFVGGVQQSIQHSYEKLKLKGKLQKVILIICTDHKMPAFKPPVLNTQLSFDLENS